MKKCLFTILAFSFIALVSCNLTELFFGEVPLSYDGEYERISEEDIEGTVWMVKTMDVGTASERECPTKNYYSQYPDFDGDGFEEYTEYSYYVYFDNGTARGYKKEVIVDEGSDTLTYPAYLAETWSHIRFNQIIHYTGDDGPYYVYRGVVNMNMDSDDQKGYMTGDSLTVRQDDYTDIWVSVSSPTPSELEAAEAYAY